MRNPTNRQPNNEARRTLGRGQEDRVEQDEAHAEDEGWNGPSQRATYLKE